MRTSGEPARSGMGAGLGRRWREAAWSAACAAGLIAGLGAGGAIAPVPASSLGARAAQPEKEPPQAAVPAGPAGWSMVVLEPGQGGRESKGFAPTASFSLREGQSLDATVRAEAMGATFSGLVTIEAGRYRFGAETQGGSARVTVYDKTGKKLGDAASAGDSRISWTAWLDMTPGQVSMSVQFSRSAAAARLRTVWEKQGTLDQGGFPPESIPASAVKPPKYTLRDIAAGASTFRGRVLMGELNCTGCHSAGPAQETVLTARAAPYLGEIGKRASPGWLLKWVSNPQAVKPGCGMPRVLSDSPQDVAEAESITHFLVSLGGPPSAKSVTPEPQTLNMGRKLYHTLGCVACHGAVEAPVKVFGEGAPDAMPSDPAPAPFGDLAGKWRAGPLSEFLRDPLKTHPAGRMPSMVLQPADADAIAAYLVDRWGAGEPAPFTPDPAKAELGKAAFAARGCASCHQLGGSQSAVASTLKAKPLSELHAGTGCLSPDDPGSPRFGLSDQDRADLASAIAAVNRVVAMGKPPATPIDEGQRLIAAYGCLRCHSRDEQGGLADSIKVFFRTSDDTELGDEGRYPPRLDGVGGKLTPAWLRTVLTDGGRARPYMAARMPQFGKLNVGRMHLLLAAMDGAPGDSAAPAKAGDETITAGRKLVGEKGMNCISCHTYAGKTAGTAGPDITAFAQRVRYSWFKSYILAPARYKPGTRMTAFFSSGIGTVQDVLSGDPDRQSEALWAYFAAGASAAPPEGLPSGGPGLPLSVADRPVVFRTFMKEAGSRGIAVGYPVGVHFGFDATAVRLVDAWEGEFIDASGAWSGRAGKIAGGQGKTVWTAPAGPALVIGPKPSEWPSATGQEGGLRFGGYKLEKDGTPVFMYAIRAVGDAASESGAPISVEEKFMPKPEPGVLIARDFRLSGVQSGQTVWVNAGEGACRLKPSGTIKVEEAEGGDEKWFGLTSQSGGTLAFRVEIQP